MRAGWRSWQVREPRDRSAAADGAEIRVSAPRSPSSAQYETIIAQGHARPTPSFGAPALVWHVAIWPRRTVDSPDGRPELCDPHDTAGVQHLEAKRDFERRRELWLQQINGFLEKLQSRCRLSPGRPRQFALAQPHDLTWQRSPADHTDFFRPIDILMQEIAPFTLWWGAAEEPEADAIRVCVHPE